LSAEQLNHLTQSLSEQTIESMEKRERASHQRVEAR
jgi:hypothetical protein